MTHAPKDLVFNPGNPQNRMLKHIWASYFKLPLKILSLPVSVCNSCSEKPMLLQVGSTIVFGDVPMVVAVILLSMLS